MKILITILLFFTLPLITKAQDIYQSNFVVENCIDSNLLVKYNKYIDTNKIEISFNKVIGIASFYSPKLNGSKTASGELYKNKKYTAASNLFLINTVVRVTNLRNGKIVLVRINDRMHPSMLKKGRIIDLSGMAAKKLAMTKKGEGIARVIVEAVDKSKLNPKND
jgi:rare lipoprotein A (peptidoglycan hydrolase)